jgi:hypothetical protein
MSTHDSCTEPSAAVMRNVTASKPDGTAPGGTVAIVPVTAGEVAGDDDAADVAVEDGTGAEAPSDEHAATTSVATTSSRGRARR